MNLKKYVDDNNLMIPDYNDLNIVDLAKFLYGNYGVNISDINKKNNDRLNGLIPRRKHTVLILVDGMGSNLINILKDNSVLKNNRKSDMITVSPSSTGCVLTSLATATYPSEHGILGWYNYYREKNIDYYPLLFVDRKNEKDLQEYGIKVDEIFRISSKFNELNVSTRVLYPDYIFNSAYSNYIANSNIRSSYSDLADAFKQISDIISSNDNTFTYLYIPYIDELEHDYGYDSVEVLDKMKEIEENVNKLTAYNDTVIILTADHGQTNMDKDILMDFNKYDKYFYAKPSIDFAMAGYYIKKDMEEDFVKEFNRDYKGRMYLFKTEEFIDNNVFGPNGISDYMSDNLGEYISLCNADAQFINSLTPLEYMNNTKGNHSGLTFDEMVIPLIVIDN